MFAVAKPYDEKEATVGNGNMIALPMDSRDQVDSMYAKAMELGATDEGEPGERTETFYGAYVRDLDGNKLVFYFLSI
jgi:predicted lactoylglutathione lyase